MKTAFRISLLGLVAAQALAMGLALPMLWWTTREPVTVTRSTWCPTPGQRAMSGPSLTKDQVLDRLREVRARLRGDDDAGAVLPEGAAADADEMLFRLIVEFDLSTTPLMEPAP